MILQGKFRDNFFQKISLSKDFVNEYRIDVFKKIVQNLRILAIAYDCWFDSKSFFNKNLKKSTEITPSEFVKNQKNTNNFTQKS